MLDELLKRLESVRELPLAPHSGKVRRQFERARPLLVQARKLNCPGAIFRTAQGVKVPPLIDLATVSPSTKLSNHIHTGL